MHLIEKSKTHRSKRRNQRLARRWTLRRILRAPTSMCTTTVKKILVDVPNLITVTVTEYHFSGVVG